jgi:predicted permease
LQRGLVVAQVAVSVVLLAGAGLLTRTMFQLSQVETGLRTEEILSMDVPLFDLSMLRAPGGDAGIRDQYDRMLREIRAVPGVIEVGLGSPAPLRRSSIVFEVKAEGKALAVGEAIPRAEVRTANPAYFSASGIPIVNGRSFAATDQAGSGLVVIINRTLADRYFPGEDPIGKRIAWTGPTLRFTPFTEAWRTIVGVAGNTQDGGLDAVSRPVVFMPFAQVLALGGTLVVRSERNVANLAPALTRIVRGIAPNALIENVMTVAQVKDESVAPRRVNAMLVSSFSVLAVLIAAVGIAGVLAFSVSARTTEIGIRMSLGADRWQVERMILGEGGVLLVAGLALGMAGAVVAARAIRGLLFGVAPYDPLTLAGVGGMMALIGIVACWIPAVRAARIDPAITMRS